MLKSNLLAALAMSCAFLASPVVAANITYTVNQSIGVGGVTGTITTNGTIGTLTTGDFTAWNLLLTGSGGATYALTNGNSGVLVGNISDPFNPNAGNADTTADALNIYFNFDGTDGGYLGFQQSFYSGEHYWCNASQGQGFDCLLGKTVVPGSFSDPHTQNVSATGNQILASVAGTVGAVPEPASWAMLLFGFGLVGVTVRRRAASPVHVAA